MNLSPPKSPPAQTRWGFLGSLRMRLILLVLLAVLPALVLVIYNALEQRSIGLKTAEDEAFRVAHLAATRQDERIESARQLLLTLSQLSEVRTLSSNECRAIFSNILTVNPIYNQLALFHPNGRLVASSPGKPDLPALQHELFSPQNPQSDRFTVGEFVVNPALNQAILPTTYPVRDAQNRLAGVLMSSLNLDWIYSFYEDADLPEGSSFTVYDKYDITLARRPDPDLEYVGQRIGSSPSTNGPGDEVRGLATPTNRFEVRQGNLASVISGRDGVPRLYASTRLGASMGTNSVRVTFGIPLAVALADSNRLLTRNLLFLSGATLLALLAAWYGGDLFVLRRVHSLLNATNDLRAGNLSARAKIVSGSGELDELARTFNEMAGELETEFANRHKAEQALKALNQDLEKRVENRTHALQRSNEDLQQFAYVASHDLKEPLRMISSYLGLLQKRYEDKLDQDGREFIEYAVDGAQRMHQLIDDLLAYSRVQTRSQAFATAPIDQILDQVLQNLEVTIRESRAVIHREPLPTLQIDPSQIAQLLQNLLTNAIKFHGDSPPEIFLRAQSRNGLWVLSVSDRGIGISPEHFQRIFVIFQRLHGRQQYPGTGIGLSICKKIVERHGGTIWVESNPDAGVTFFFTLPEHQPPGPDGESP